MTNNGVRGKSAQKSSYCSFLEQLRRQRPLAIRFACPSQRQPRSREISGLGSFVFRTTGFNSIRTLSARLAYFQAISGNRLAYLPLELRLRGKSTRQSLGTPIYYVDLTVRSGVSVEDALTEAKRLETERVSAGFDQVSLETAARLGFSNGAFEESDDEGESVVEEFYPGGGRSHDTGEDGAAISSAQPVRPSLADKLEDRTARLEVEM